MAGLPPKPLPLLSRVLELFEYQPDTGEFIRKLAVNNSTRVGEIVGSLHHSGRYYIRVDGARYPRARLAWYVTTWLDPGPSPIDHINRDKGDDSIDNLRLYTDSLNSSNREFPDNLTGYRYVYRKPWRDGSYRYYYHDRLNNIRTGYYNTPEEAHKAGHG